MSNIKSLNFAKVAIFALVALVVLGFAVLPALASYTHTVTLRAGSTGPQVVAAQQALMGLGYSLPVYGADGDFGGETSAAVREFQAASSLTVDGIIGPVTGAVLEATPSAPGTTLPAGCLTASGYSTTTGEPCVPSTANLPAGCTSTAGYSPTTGEKCDSGSTLPAGCTSTAGYSPTTGEKCDGGSSSSSSGTLMGGAGSIEDADFVTSLNNEEVGEGKNDVEVAGLDIEADEGSDLRVTAVRLVFDQGTANRDFDRYADEVSLWLDGDEIARLDADEFTEDSSDNFTKTVSVSSNAIIRAGDTGRLVVAISGISNLDSADEGETWTVEFDTIRFEDAQGAIISDTATGDIGATRTFSFDAFAGSANLELKLSLGDDSVNDAHIINVHASNDTDDVPVLSFDIEVEGTSDVMIEDLPFLLTTGGMNIDDAIPSVYLYADGDLIGTENTTSATTTETITFDNVNYTIDAGDTVRFEIRVDINDLDATSGAEVAEGDTIKAEITATERALIDAEDETGEDVATGDMSGTAVGDAHSIYDVGFHLELVSTSQKKSFESETSGTGDQGEFIIKYKVTAFDGDIYIDNTCVEDNDGSEVSTATSYSITNDADNTTNCVVTASAPNPTNADSANTFLVKEGSGNARTFTLTVNATATADDFAQVKLEAIGWDTAAGGDDNVFDFDLPGDFETDPVFLNLF